MKRIILYIIIHSSFFVMAHAQAVLDIDLLQAKTRGEALVSAYNNCIARRDAYWGLGCDGAAVAFDNAEVRDAGGQLLFRDAFSSEKLEWNYYGGTWELSEGRMCQLDSRTSAFDMQVCYVSPGHDGSVAVDAIRQSDSGGIILVFSLTDRDNFIRWSLGVDGNISKVEQSTDGSMQTLATAELSLQTNRNYRLEAKFSGTDVVLSLDGETIHELTLEGTPKLTATATCAPDLSTVRINVVNNTDIPQPTTLRIHHADIDAASIQSDGTERSLTLSDSNGIYTTIDANSTCIYVLQLSGEVPSAIEVPFSDGFILSHKEGEEERLYDLSGRQVSAQQRCLAPGIYIKNGKKYFIR